MLGFISKFFGNKSEKDIKAIQPLIDQIHAAAAKLEHNSHDTLRSKTTYFKHIIQQGLEKIDEQVHAIKEKIKENANLEVNEKVVLYKQIDTLEKERNATLEKLLAQILPDAFAVMRETARRFACHETLEVLATPFDQQLAAKKSNVIIKGDKAIHHNTWLVSGKKLVWNMVHYDVQLIGGIVLHQGKIAEMATGEGKTLVATLPAYLNALAGKGVHIVTVNDYLALRDSEWMGPLYEFHGLSVDCIDRYEPNSNDRRNAYLADVTFGTNNEFGFDYLRDNMAHHPDELVQRTLHYAMVDEVDSVLIDDARTPLIISGPIPHGDEHEFYELKPRVERLVHVQKGHVASILNEAKKLIKEGKSGVEEGGLYLLRAHRGLPKNKALIKFLSEPGNKQILTKAENYYMQDQGKEIPKVDVELYFTIDEKNNQVELTEKGIEAITASGEDPHFFILPDVGTGVADIEKSNLSSTEKIAKKDTLMRDFSIKSERIHSINQLLRAYTLFEKDVAYILDSGRVKIVDEQTGRILDGRRYSDGLHQAIEAKENVKVEDATQTFATITLQNYFRMYHKLCGMTGTAVTEAGEFWEIYKLDVVEIPSNKPIKRIDHHDLVYRTMREKYQAIINEIEQLLQAGRPVLVGTTSVEISELLSRMLQLRGIKHNVLNAKLHKKEADIIAAAGQAGMITIATNMAGRGTDIKITQEVKEAGGLAIIGTERHESRRVDRQLRGRSGRQGDPGSSQFFISLEDNLMRLFGSERIANLMLRMGIKEGEVIQHAMVTKSIERAQKKVEENNFGIRKRLLEYDDVMNAQRTVIYEKRENALLGERLDIDLDNNLFDVVEDVVTEYKNANNYEGFQLEIARLFSIDTLPIASYEFSHSATPTTLIEQVFPHVKEVYEHKSELIVKEAYPILKNALAIRGEHTADIILPFTDGIRTISVAIALNKAVHNDAYEVVRSLEKNVLLTLIDDAWKEHLYVMDELKQSVQNAIYEQKDPLLVYKFEAFELFRQMLINMHKDIVSFLFRAKLPAQQQAHKLQEALPRTKLDIQKLQVLKPELVREDKGITREDDYGTWAKSTPVRVKQKIGRNDPCPCNSGKKYKNCHGRVLVVVFFLLISGVLFTNSFAQGSGTVTVVKDPRIDSLIAYRAVSTKQSVNGLCVPAYLRRGFRIQIYSGSNKQDAYDQQAQFKDAYPTIPTYIIYQEPNYKLRVGDFRTHLEARKLMEDLRERFQAVFLVADKINPPK